jgi:hypothetical protein
MGAILNLVSLKKLRLEGSIFNDISEQKLFVERFSSLKTLRSFEFRGCKGDRHELPSGNFALPFLTAVEWTWAIPFARLPLGGFLTGSGKSYFNLGTDEMLR